jgi:nucleoid-associated protein YgaU
MDLKQILKTIKLNEPNISMVLGGIVILILGILVVNYFKNLNNQTPSITDNSASDTVNPVEHIVTKGESLWSISQKYLNSGSHWEDIAKINELKAPYTIEVGQKLMVPTFDEPNLANEPQSPTPNPTVKTPVQTANAITGATYEVVKGDCLWTIAVRAYGDGFKWPSIAKENKLKNPDLIHAGNIFILPR